MRELLPPEIAKWQYVEEKVRAVLDAFGFREVRTQAVAPDGSLRAPGPAALARAYLGHALWQRDPVTRWYELGPAFRRAHDRVLTITQLAAVRFGPGSPAADAEIIAMVVGLLGEAGVPPPATALTVDAPPARRDHLERVRGLLAALHVRAEVGHGTPGELSFTIAAEDVAVAHGGRADGLVASLGGPAVPALTFTLDLATLVEAVPDPAESFLPPPAAVLLADGARAAEWALTTAHRLRLGGVRLALDPDPTARLRVTVRDEDLARGRVIVEDLATGDREEVAEDELEATIRQRLD
jgi:histidyl-tRNA synthetase